MANALTTTGETDQFIKSAKALMTDEQRNEIVNTLACYPMMGDAIPGTGGFRKARFAGKGKGKRGGFRVIWFPGTKTRPNYVIDVFSKNVKIDLTKDQQNQLKAYAQKLKA